MSVSFRFRWIPCVVTVLLVILGWNLAQWQTRRGDDKQKLASQMAVRSQHAALDWNPQRQPLVAPFTRVRVRGEFVAGWPVYLDNRPLDGRAGRYVLMPFRIENTQQLVLIARGWVARDPQDRLKFPLLTTPSGVLDIEGIIRDHLEQVMQLGQAETVKPGALLQNLDMVSFAKQSGLNMYPQLIEQTSDTHDDLLRNWPLPSAGIEKHRAYALQWYALCVMACFYFIFSGIRRGTKTETTN